MYEIDGKIFEQHGEYEGSLYVWRSDGYTKTAIVHAYEANIATTGLSPDEHGEMLAVLVAFCRRIAEKTDVEMF